MRADVATPSGSEPTPAADATDERPHQRSRRPSADAALTGRLVTVLEDYRAALTTAALSDNARRGYGSRVAGFLEWLATRPEPDADGDPLTQPEARDDAVRDYRSWLTTVRDASPWTINAHLTALDHFYAHHLGLGAPGAPRERITPTAREALEPDEQRRFIRACGRAGSARDTAIGLLLLYTGLRVEEVEALDVDDVLMSARCGTVIVREGNGRSHREVPLHRAARVALRGWLDVRPTHRGADTAAALFLSRRGERMRTRALRYVVAELAAAAQLVYEPGHPDAGKPRVHPRILRNTFGIQLLRSGIGRGVVSALMGGTTLDTTHDDTPDDTDTGTGAGTADDAIADAIADAIEAALIAEE